MMTEKELKEFREYCQRIDRMVKEYEAMRLDRDLKPLSDRLRIDLVVLKAMIGLNLALTAALVLKAFAWRLRWSDAGHHGGEMSDARDVEICRLQDEVRYLRTQNDLLTKILQLEFARRLPRRSEQMRTVHEIINSLQFGFHKK
jgi:hypothetical protein